jgi:starch-binding outer membrane protein, SusD/RagB family
MNAYNKTIPGWARWGAALIALAGAAACTTDEILSVTDPDIIPPVSVPSPAGANATRLGALARLNTSTSGGESLFLLGGLFSDEWNNGDSFIARQEIDQRVITIENSFLTTANRALHRARLSAEQAVLLLNEFVPTGPVANVAEMYFVQAFVENLMAEHYCNGIIFSTIVDGVEQYGERITTAETLTRALAHADSGLALVTGTTAADVRVRNALRVVRARILLNLNRPADAGLALATVPTNFVYQQVHGTTTTENQIWAFNNSARRYSVSTGEGTNGLNFAAANDPRVPVCTGGDATCRTIGVTSTQRDDLTSPLFVQRIWPTRESAVTIASGVEARLVEAEAALRANDLTTYLAKLNDARTNGGVSGLAALTDPGSADARVNLLFRERGFWMFSTGHRVGDLRRLVRQYNRAANTVFPTGAWHKGGNYGSDVTVPLPQAEQNNPTVGTGNDACLDRAP